MTAIIECIYLSVPAEFCRKYEVADVSTTRVLAIDMGWEDTIFVVDHTLFHLKLLVFPMSHFVAGEHRIWTCPLFPTHFVI